MLSYLPHSFSWEKGLAGQWSAEAGGAVADHCCAENAEHTFTTNSSRACGVSQGLDWIFAYNTTIF